MSVKIILARLIFYLKLMIYFPESKEDIECLIIIADSLQ